MQKVRKGPPIKVGREIPHAGGGEAPHRGGAVPHRGGEYPH